jgi:hypothetical protein
VIHHYSMPETQFKTNCIKICISPTISREIVDVEFVDRAPTIRCPFLAKLFHGKNVSNIEALHLFIGPTRASILSIDPTKSRLHLM